MRTSKKPPNARGAPPNAVGFAFGTLCVQPQWMEPPAHSVAMDMWTPYRDAVQAVLPDARIVIDKFHVVRIANDAVEKIRKSLREQLTPKQRRA